MKAIQRRIAYSLVSIILWIHLLVATFVTAFVGHAKCRCHRTATTNLAAATNINNKTIFLSCTCKGLFPHDGTSRALTIPEALTVSVEGVDETHWIAPHGDGDEDKETFWIAVPLDNKLSSSSSSLTSDASVLVCICASRYIRLSLARLAVVEDDEQSTRHVVTPTPTTVMVDPALHDPFAVVQSVIHNQGADSVHIIGDLTGKARVYANSQASPLYYKPGDVVVAVRVQQRNNQSNEY